MRDDFNDEETVEVWLDFFEALKKTQYQAALETSIFTMAHSTTKFEVYFKNFQEELTQLSKEIESAKEVLGNNIDKTLAAQLQTSLNKLLEFCNDFAKSQFPVELTQEQIGKNIILNTLENSINDFNGTFKKIKI